SFFFFQAEDGIRDFHVTGVQTCALPICHRARAKREKDEEDVYQAGPLLAEIEKSRPETPRFERLAPGETGLNPRQTFHTFAVGRSEERRVGKECSSQWRPYCAKQHGRGN